MDAGSACREVFVLLDSPLLGDCESECDAKGYKHMPSLMEMLRMAHTATKCFLAVVFEGLIMCASADLVTSQTPL